MRRIKLPSHSVVTFLITVLATIYVCNLMIAFKRKTYPAADDFDALVSFRQGAHQLRLSRAAEVHSRHPIRNQPIESDSQGEGRAGFGEGEDDERRGSESSTDNASETFRKESLEDKETGDSTRPDESPRDQPSESEENEEDNISKEELDADGETNRSGEDDTGEEYPLKSHVVPILNNTIRAVPRKREWFERRKQGMERSWAQTMKFVARHPNITLPSSLKERAPNFLLIGAQKSGTTALRTYLSKHPLIQVPTDVGETHYFDRHFPENATPQQHLDAYVEQYFDRDCRKNESLCIAGENTPIYLFDTEHVPARVKAVAPWTKFIVLLRDPVKRAISHCNMLIERNEIKDTFEMRLERDFKILMQSGLVSNATLSHDEEIEAWRRYLTPTTAKSRWKKLPIGRGFYELQLRRWLRYFPREQFLILKSEDLDSDRSATLKRVFDFLGVPFHAARKHDKKIHQRAYSFTVADDVRDFLYDFYRPYNKKLASLLGPEWDGVWENPRQQSSR